MCTEWKALNLCLRLGHLNGKVLLFIIAMSSEPADILHTEGSSSTSVERPLIITLPNDGPSGHSAVRGRMRIHR